MFKGIIVHESYELIYTYCSFSYKFPSHKTLLFVFVRGLALFIMLICNSRHASSTFYLLAPCAKSNSILWRVSL